ncbi:MAG TPA: beta-galactosidase [Verrucomicrobia bacterium]|nr:beta-galactosidase [Verrucomicrobiota bacterium]
MIKRYDPINSACRKMLHGGDYNPDQWIRTPEIWDEDMRLMKLAGCNAMSVGIFSWSMLEPEEGRFTFEWLDTIMDKLAAIGAFAVMATPSGSKPAWLSRAYPEACRVNAEGVRQRHGGRHNHCRTSPVYREKCVQINTRMAERYKDHPALLVWHASNEYNGGDCHCELCVSWFQRWLKERYETIENLNQAYWSSFWSHSFPDFSYVLPTDKGIHGLMLDWERFKTHQTIDFFNTECAPLRTITPTVPVTTNFMNGSETLDYWAFAKAVDVISWDSYPNWHESKDEIHEAVSTALLHDQCRSMKQGKPWMLMESVPSIPTRGRVKKRKEPGMHLLSSLQAIAHGSDTVQYFQWRKSRGCMEKFHGAVVDHVGNEHTREFREVADVGAALARLDAIVGTSVKPEVAVIQDWENEWAIREGARIYLGENTKYRDECASHYQAFWQQGVPTDVIDQECSLEPYKLVVIPMAYLLRPGFASRIKRFVAEGGTAVMTYWSGVVDSTDLCYLGGIPGDGLREVFGVWEEESQSYYAHESVGIAAVDGNTAGLSGTYKAVDTCSVIHAEGSTVLATYADQYFAGTPAATVNAYGKGRAYYLAARTRDAFIADFYGNLVAELAISRAIAVDLPAGVTAQLRTDGETRYVFLLNFNASEVTVPLDGCYGDMLAGGTVDTRVTLARYGVRVLSRKA